METINLKVPAGTKARLRTLNPNISALLREEISRLLDRESDESAHRKVAHLCGVVKGGPKNASTSRDYLRKYAPKRAH